jgi:hypothetical protein
MKLKTRLLISFIFAIVILSFSSLSYSKIFMWKEGKTAHVIYDMPAWWPTGSYSKCITWVPGKKNKMVDKLATLKKKEIKKAQLVVAKELAAEELKAEELATRKLEAQMLEAKKKFTPNTSSSNEKNKISASAGNWYEGGTLHKSNVAAWNSSTYKNKLATAADWVLTSPSVKTAVQNSGDINTTITYAIELVACIDKATDGIELINTKRTTEIAEIAAICMVLMNYL